MSSPNWINPAFTSLQIVSSYMSLTSSERDLLDEVINLLKQADSSRQNPRELLRLFGEGFSKYTKLPEKVKKDTSIYLYNALMEAGMIANRNKIHVVFDIDGARFT